MDGCPELLFPAVPAVRRGDGAVHLLRCRLVVPEVLANAAKDEGEKTSSPALKARQARAAGG